MSLDDLNSENPKHVQLAKYVKENPVSTVIDSEEDPIKVEYFIWQCQGKGFEDITYIEFDVRLKALISLYSIYLSHSNTGGDIWRMLVILSKSKYYLRYVHARPGQTACIPIL